MRFPLNFCAAAAQSSAMMAFWFSCLLYTSNTLTENGTVSRGVCTADENGLLAHIIERTAIHRDADGVIPVSYTHLPS